MRNVELLKKHSIKDEKGEPRTITQGKNVMFLGIEGNKDYEADFNLLKEEFKQDIADFEQNEKDANAWMEEEVDVKVTQIAIDELPETVSLAEIEQIGVLIK